MPLLLGPQNHRVVVTSEVEADSKMMWAPPTVLNIALTALLLLTSFAAGSSHAPNPRNLPDFLGQTSRSLEMTRDQLTAAIFAAFASTECTSDSTTTSSTGTLPDGSEVQYTYTNYDVTCTDQEKSVTLHLVVLEGQDGYSGTVEVTYNGQWTLTLDLASSMCTIESTSGVYCDCEICQTDSVLLGITASCPTPLGGSYDPFQGECVGVASVVSGDASTNSTSGGGGGGYSDVSFEELSAALQSGFLSNQACASTASTLNCTSANGRSVYLSQTPSSTGGDGQLNTLILNSTPGKFTATVDFTTKSCTVTSSGMTCVCSLCQDARGDFGVAASCPVDSSSNATSPFSGECISAQDLSDDGLPSTAAYDVIASDLMRSYAPENCDSTHSSSSDGTVGYQLSCTGNDQSALMSGTEANGTLLVDTLTITANDAWFLSIDYSMHICTVQMGDASCDACSLCRSNDGGYGITASCPGNLTKVFSPTRCVNVARLARDSGNYAEDDRNTFDDVSKDVQSVFSADTCSLQETQLNCSSVDGRTVTVSGTKVGNSTVELEELHIYIVGVYVIHLEVGNKTQCSVELVNGVCDCTYCGADDGEFGIMSLCSEGTTEYTRLTTGECVAVSDLSEGMKSDNGDDEEDEINAPPFFRLVGYLADAFPEDACLKNTSKDAYRETLKNGTDVYKSRNFFRMNCTYEDRMAFVNMTDDNGVEQMGKLEVQVDPTVRVSFDFEAGSCLIQTDGTDCLNCTTCKYSDDHEYGILGYCPGASATSVFKDYSCVSVTDIAGGKFFDNTTDDVIDDPVNATTDDLVGSNTTAEDDWANYANDDDTSSVNGTDDKATGDDVGDDDGDDPDGDDDESDDEFGGTPSGSNTTEPTNDGGGSTSNSTNPDSPNEGQAPSTSKAGRFATSIPTTLLASVALKLLLRWV